MDLMGPPEFSRRNALLSAKLDVDGSDKPLDGMTLSLRNEVMAIFKADLKRMMKLQ